MLSHVAYAIAKSQYGFTQHRSCLTNIQITEVGNNQLEKDNTVNIVFLDFAKAFDSVNHSIFAQSCLLLKSAVNGLKNLSNKPCFIKVGDVISSRWFIPARISKYWVPTSSSRQEFGGTADLQPQLWRKTNKSWFIFNISLTSPRDLNFSMSTENRPHSMGILYRSSFAISVVPFRNR